ncbi:MAG: GNAT family N-acetyltransferase [Aigarchaeota archaeon]|nr:GNAT family N-acetyltransferase [Candidatus Pelearchaeum maunauluense]
MTTVTFRKATLNDLDRLVDLLIRQKRLNEEFDPLLRLREDIAETGRKYLEEAIMSENSLVVVAEADGRVVGFLKADIKERLFYYPKTEGNIVELYLLPEYRRKGNGVKLLEYAVNILKERAEIITAEFPSLNEIATRFYTNLNFRAIISTYARETIIKK